jgi:hypothetical protein
VRGAKVHIPSPALSDILLSALRGGGESGDGIELAIDDIEYDGGEGADDSGEQDTIDFYAALRQHDEAMTSVTTTRVDAVRAVCWGF